LLVFQIKRLGQLVCGGMRANLAEQYVTERRASNIDALMEELDDLTAPLEAAGVVANPPAPPLPLLRLEAHQHGTAAGDGEGAFDQFAVRRQGGQGLPIVHGGHGGAAQGAVTLATGVEQPFAAHGREAWRSSDSPGGEAVMSTQLKGAGLHGDAPLGEPLQGLAAGAAGGIAVEAEGGLAHAAASLADQGLEDNMN
jgi:hypothetical protein